MRHSFLSERGLERFASPTWQQTTATLVRASDVLVFMEHHHYIFCKTWIDVSRQKLEIWDMQDVRAADAAAIMNEAEHTFDLIRQRTDMLLTTLGLS